MLQRAVSELGVVGLKIHPAAGFFPNDPVVYPMYHKALDLGLPVMVHTGPEPKPLYSRHCQPVYLDDVAADFPDLTIIMAHAGLSAWWQEAGIASVCPNIYLDISGWQPSARLRPLVLHQPAFSGEHRGRRPDLGGQRLSGAAAVDVRVFMGDNASRLLGL